jgi:hypothetical protein
MRRSLVRCGRQLVVLLPLVLLLGCSATWGRESRTITAEQIQHFGAADAWEVIERSGTPLDAPDAGPPRRADDGFSLRDVPRVIVDGVQMLDLRLLRSIPTHIISSIRILSGIGDAAPSNGGHDSGIILIRTRGG